MKTSGCRARYSAIAVVPHLGAPTMKKSGFRCSADRTLRLTSDRYQLRKFIFYKQLPRPGRQTIFGSAHLMTSAPSVMR